MISCTSRDFKSQEPTRPSKGEHREGTCRAQLNAFPRAGTMVPRMQRSQLEARDPVSMLSEQRHQGRQLPLRVRHGRDSKCFRLVKTVTRRRKRIIQNRMQEQRSPRQSLLAFNHLSRRRLDKWMLSPDLQGQGQGML